jgi:hypothetical protein
LCFREVRVRNSTHRQAARYRPVSNLTRPRVSLRTGHNRTHDFLY